MTSKCDSRGSANVHLSINLMYLFSDVDIILYLAYFSKYYQSLSHDAHMLSRKKLTVLISNENDILPNPFCDQ